MIELKSNWFVRTIPWGLEEILDDIDGIIKNIDWRTARNIGFSPRMSDDRIKVR